MIKTSRKFQFDLAALVGSSEHLSGCFCPCACVRESANVHEQTGSDGFSNPCLGRYYFIVYVKHQVVKDIPCDHSITHSVKMLELGEESSFPNLF